MLTNANCVRISIVNMLSLCNAIQPALGLDYEIFRCICRRWNGQEMVKRDVEQLPTTTTMMMAMAMANDYNCQRSE